MQIGFIPNNTAYFSVSPLNATSPAGTTEDLSTGTEPITPTPTPTPTPPTEDMDDIITPELDNNFVWSDVYRCPQYFVVNGRTGKVICRIAPYLATPLWLSKLSYTVYVYSAKYAFLTAHIEGITILTDLGETVTLNIETRTQISYNTYFDVISWQKGNPVLGLDVELGFVGDFDTSTPSPETPDPYTPSPDTPSPDTPSPDTPSPDILTPETTGEATTNGPLPMRNKLKDNDNFILLE